MRPFRHAVALALLLAGAVPSVVAAPVVTYQGELVNGTTPVNSNQDFRVIAYDALVGGSQVGPVVQVPNVQVRAGLFTLALDFGSVFGGGDLYFEISVRPSGTGAYTVLSPRQAVTAAPLAAALALPVAHNESSSGSLFVVDNDGSGQAAEFRSSSTFATVYVSNNGPGGTLRADTGSSGQGSALTGYNYGTDRYAGEFELVNSSNPRAAIYARTAGNGQAADLEVNSNTNGDALFARTTSSSASSYAGIFVGNVSISGNLAKSSGSFKIDHPLDPENRTLSHSFVESPDMKNLYDGVVALDASGAAEIELPEWFGALNRDFRYQLTALGGASPNLHVAQEIEANRFRIAGGIPNARVSWQVTGTRQDAYARRFPVPVEEWKPVEERGTYLVPAAYGLGVERSAHAREHPIAEPVPLD